MIYLDNAATTPLDGVVLDTMLPFMKERFGNAGAVYRLGHEAASAIERARSQVAAMLNAHQMQILFTSGGTESNNMVFASTAEILSRLGKKHLIVSSVEHPSVLRAAESMKKHGFSLTYLPVDHTGVVGPEALQEALRPDTGLVSVMCTNNETGASNPIPELGQMCASHGALFHTDCVQAAGCAALDVEAFHCDFLSLSSHKIHGPKGVGALFVRRPEILTPMIYGGAYQEFGLRGGTENVPGIVGFGKACEITTERLHEFCVHTSTLRQLFYRSLVEALEPYGLGQIVHINGPSVLKNGKTLSLRFDHTDGETLLILLSSRGVFVSAGSACHSHESEPSHVLTAMGLTRDEAMNTIRISFSRMNHEEEVRQAAAILAECVVSLYDRNGGAYRDGNTAEE